MDFKPSFSVHSVCKNSYWARTTKLEWWQVVKYLVCLTDHDLSRNTLRPQNKRTAWLFILIAEMQKVYHSLCLYVWVSVCVWICVWLCMCISLSVCAQYACNMLYIHRLLFFGTSNMLVLNSAWATFTQHMSAIANVRSFRNCTSAHVNVQNICVKRQVVCCRLGYTLQTICVYVLGGLTPGVLSVLSNLAGGSCTWIVCICVSVCVCMSRLLGIFSADMTGFIHYSQIQRFIDLTVSLYYCLTLFRLTYTHRHTHK